MSESIYFNENNKNILTIDIRMAEKSGIGRYLKNLVPGLINSLSDEIYIYLVGKRKDAELLTSEVESEKFELIHFEAPVYSIKEQLFLPSCIPEATDLLWVPHYNIPLFYTGKILVTVHDIYHLKTTDSWLHWLKNIYSWCLFQGLKRKNYDIISVSNFTKQELVDYLNFPPEKIDVIHSGIEQKFFSNCSDQDQYILYTGNLKPHKNIGTLIEAFNRVKKEIPHKLRITGEYQSLRTKDKKVKKIIEQSDRIIFEGFVPEEKLLDLYSRAALFVFPSKYEGFGFSPLEAMAAGTPTIVSDRASLPEACGNGAVYFDPTDSKKLSELMVKILKNNQFSNKWSKKAREKANEYSWNKSVEEYVTKIKKLVGALNQGQA